MVVYFLISDFIPDILVAQFTLIIHSDTMVLAVRSLYDTYFNPVTELPSYEYLIWLSIIF
jgi:hypothetical protein